MMRSIAQSTRYAGTARRRGVVGVLIVLSVLVAACSGSDGGHRDSAPAGSGAAGSSAAHSLFSAAAASASSAPAVSATSAEAGTSAALDPPLIATTFNGLTFQHPASWQYLARAPAVRSPGPIQLLGYLTNAVVTPPCASGQPGNLCSYPAPSLGPLGVLVTVTEQFSPNSPISSNRTIAGRQALTTEPEAATACVPGAKYVQQTVIDTNGKTILLACFGSDNAAGRVQLDEMLRTATFK